MSTVLLAWELGMGLWHAHQLRLVGRALAERGHKVTYAVANPVDTWPVLGAESAPILQAPLGIPRVRAEDDEFAAESFADVLYEAGFYSADVLRPLVAAWDGMLELMRPDLIVADHAPSLLVAALGRIPVVQIGLGFTQPPADLDPMPSLRPPYEGSTNEPTALATLREVAQDRGLEAPTSLGSLYKSAASFVTTFPEFDPYRPLRKGAPWGALEPLPAPMAAPKSKSYFAYLSADIAASGQVLRELSESGIPGQAYLRGAHPSLKKALREAGVDLLDAPASMEDVLAEHAIIVHHGGVGTSQQAASAGRPQVLLPWHLEQGCNAGVLEGCGLGRRLKGAGEAADVVRELLDDDESAKKALSFARLVEARGTVPALSQVAEGCELILGDLRRRS
jgi:hypothetical protein